MIPGNLTSDDYVAFRVDVDRFERDVAYGTLTNIFSPRADSIFYLTERIGVGLAPRAP